MKLHHILFIGISALALNPEAKASEEAKSFIDFAFSMNEMEDVDRLLKENDSHRYTLLMAAAQVADKETFAKAVAKSKNIDAVDAENRTALFHAYYGENPDNLTHLIKNGASINHKNSAGETVLRKSVESGDWQIAMILINNGAEIPHQVVPRYSIVSMEAHREMVKERAILKAAALAKSTLSEAKERAEDQQSDSSPLLSSLQRLAEQDDAKTSHQTAHKKKNNTPRKKTTIKIQPKGKKRPTQKKSPDHTKTKDDTVKTPETKPAATVALAITAATPSATTAAAADSSESQTPTTKDDQKKAPKKAKTGPQETDIKSLLKTFNNSSAKYEAALAVKELIYIEKVRTLRDRYRAVLTAFKEKDYQGPERKEVVARIKILKAKIEHLKRFAK